MTMIVMVRELRYGRHPKTYYRDDTIVPENDRDAKLLKAIGKIAEAPARLAEPYRKAATVVRPPPPAPPGEDATEAERVQLARLTNTNLRGLAAEEGAEIGEDDTKASLVDKIAANRYRTRRLRVGE